jgi:hypothetical protein
MFFFKKNSRLLQELVKPIPCPVKYVLGHVEVIRLIFECTTLSYTALLSHQLKDSKGFTHKCTCTPISFRCINLHKPKKEKTKCLNHTRKATKFSITLRCEWISNSLHKRPTYTSTSKEEELNLLLSCWGTVSFI